MENLTTETQRIRRVTELIRDLGATETRGAAHARWDDSHLDPKLLPQYLSAFASFFSTRSVAHAIFRNDQAHVTQRNSPRARGAANKFFAA
jgi:hypothetical protein